MHIVLLGLEHNSFLASQLVTFSNHKLPAYSMAAVDTFMVLFGPDQFAV